LPDPPTSTTVAVPRLVREEYLLEVEAIAVVP
jgi:enamine deaminase RidA (YjgF/YER057c/UK114 family)